jgi:hypothetical protein
MQLHVLPGGDDGGDNVLNRGHAPYQRGHGIDEEHRFLAVAGEQIELVRDASRALRGVAGDRARKVIRPVGRARPGVKPRGILGINRDEDPRHDPGCVAQEG